MSHTKGPPATRGRACACWAAALLSGAFVLFFPASRKSSGPAGASQPHVLGAGLSRPGWASSLLMTWPGSTCSPKSSSTLLCRVSVRRRASRGLRLPQGQGAGPGLLLAATFLKLKRRSSSSLPQSRPLSGLLVAEWPNRQPLSSRIKSSAWGPAVGPLGLAGNREPCGGCQALGERPKPCLCVDSHCPPSSSATSGMLNSLVPCWDCRGHSGCSGRASGVLLLQHS